MGHEVTREEAAIKKKRKGCGGGEPWNHERSGLRKTLGIISYTKNKVWIPYPSSPGSMWIGSTFSISSWDLLLGDNLQTAITVARKSGMVSESQKVILIEANEPTGSSSASISWKLVEEKKHIVYKNQVYLKTDLMPHYLTCHTELATEQLWLADVYLRSTYFFKCLPCMQFKELSYISFPYHSYWALR